MNKVILIGRVGNFEEKEYQGNKFYTLSVATRKSWKDKNEEWQEITSWHNVVAKYANCAVGDIVSVDGELSYKKKDDKIYTSIKAHKVSVIQKKEAKETQTEKPVAV